MRTVAVEKLQERKWAVAIFVGTVLAVLALGLVLMAGPAKAAPGDCGTNDCGGGGDTGDTIAPDTTITNGPPNLTNQTSVTFSFSADEAPATFECKLDRPGSAGTFEPCGGPTTATTDVVSKNYSGLTTNGTYTFEVRATDGALNTDSSPATRSFTLDTVPPPSPSINTRPPDLINSTTVSWTFSGEPGATFRCSMDSTTNFFGCTSGQSYIVSEGTHIFRVRAVDQAGNVGLYAEDSFTVDTTPPNTIIQNKPNNPTKETVANFTYTSTEPNSTFQCRLDGPSNAHAFSSCDPTGKSYSNLTDGTYTFEVRARDQAGNADPGPASHIWTVDTTGPTASITGGPNEGQIRTSGSETFTLTGAETGGGYQCSVDSTTNFSVCSSGQSFNVTDGTHTFRVKAFDGLGNFGPTTSRTWTTDTTAPTLNITEGPDNETFRGGSTQTWKFNAGDATSGVNNVRCSVVTTGDPRSFGPCSGGNSEHSRAGLSGGTYEFAVRATDLAGHDSSVQTRTFTIDTNSPTVETWSPKGKKVKPTAKPTVTFSEKMDEASVEKSANGKPTTFVLKKGKIVIPASVVYTESGTTFKAVLTPNKKLKKGAKYTATVTSAATDAVGNALVAKTWKFTVKP